jgi:hypothetical protein
LQMEKEYSIRILKSQSVWKEVFLFYYFHLIGKCPEMALVSQQNVFLFIRMWKLEGIALENCFLW